MQRENVCWTLCRQFSCEEGGVQAPTVDLVPSHSASRYPLGHFCSFRDRALSSRNGHYRLAPTRSLLHAVLAQPSGRDNLVGSCFCWISVDGIGLRLAKKSTRFVSGACGFLPLGIGLRGSSPRPTSL